MSRRFQAAAAFRFRLVLNLAHVSALSFTRRCSIRPSLVHACITGLDFLRPFLGLVNISAVAYHFCLTCLQYPRNLGRNGLIVGPVYCVYFPGGARIERGQFICFSNKRDAAAQRRGGGAK